MHCHLSLSFQCSSTTAARARPCRRRRASSTTACPWATARARRGSRAPRDTPTPRRVWSKVSPEWNGGECSNCEAKLKITGLRSKFEQKVSYQINAHAFTCGKIRSSIKHLRSPIPVTSCPSLQTPVSPVTTGTATWASALRAPRASTSRSGARPAACPAPSTPPRTPTGRGRPQSANVSEESRDRFTKKYIRKIEL